MTTSVLQRKQQYRERVLLDLALGRPAPAESHPYLENPRLEAKEYQAGRWGEEMGMAELTASIKEMYAQWDAVAQAKREQAAQARATRA